MAGTDGKEIPTWTNRLFVEMTTEFDFSPEEAAEVVGKTLEETSVPMNTAGDGITFKVRAVFPADEPH